MPEEGAYFPPTLITGLAPSDGLMQDEIFGPVLVSTTFRTPDEAVTLANNTRFGLAASVWSENLSLALGVAPRLEAGVIWVNGANMFDAAAPFGGVRESGFGREGGWAGLDAYLRPAAKPKTLRPEAGFTGSGAVEGMDRTPKLYIGGKQARPDGDTPASSTANPARRWGRCRSQTARMSATRWRRHAQRRDGRGPMVMVGRRSFITWPRTCQHVRTTLPGC